MNPAKSLLVVVWLGISITLILTSGVDFSSGLEDAVSFYCCSDNCNTDPLTISNCKEGYLRDPPLSLQVNFILYLSVSNKLGCDYRENCLRKVGFYSRQKESEPWKEMVSFFSAQCTTKHSNNDSLTNDNKNQKFEATGSIFHFKRESNPLSVTIHVRSEHWLEQPQIQLGWFGEYPIQTRVNRKCSDMYEYAGGWWISDLSVSSLFDGVMTPVLKETFEGDTVGSLLLDISGNAKIIDADDGKWILFFNHSHLLTKNSKDSCVSKMLLLIPNEKFEDVKLETDRESESWITQRMARHSDENNDHAVTKRMSNSNNNGCDAFTPGGCKCKGKGNENCNPSTTEPTVTTAGTIQPSDITTGTAEPIDTTTGTAEPTDTTRDTTEPTVTTTGTEEPTDTTATAGTAEPTHNTAGTEEPTDTTATAGTAEPTDTTTGTAEPTDTTTGTAKPTDTTTGTAEPTDTTTGTADPTDTTTGTADPTDTTTGTAEPTDTTTGIAEPTDTTRDTTEPTTTTTGTAEPTDTTTGTAEPTDTTTGTADPTDTTAGTADPTDTTRDTTDTTATAGTAEPTDTTTSGTSVGDTTVTIEETTQPQTSTNSANDCSDSDCTTIVQPPEVQALISNIMMELDTVIESVLNSKDSMDTTAAVSMLTSVINALLSQPLVVSTIDIDENKFLSAIGGLLKSVESLPPSERSSEASKILQLLDITALRVFEEGISDIGSIKALVVTENLSNYNGSLSGIEVNGTAIQIPRVLLEKTTGQESEAVRMASIYFSNLKQVLLENSTMNNLASPVISTAFLCGENVCNTSTEAVELGPNAHVRITLEHSKNLPAQDQPQRCSFWEFTSQQNGMWSQNGCSLNSNESNASLTVCECNHLTHFAILLSPGVELSEEDEFALTVIGYVGISISFVALTITALVFICFKSLWSMRNYIHIQLCLTIMAAQLVFVIAVDKTDNQIGCAVSAVLLQYLFLVSFMWMLMEGVVLYVVLVKVFTKSTIVKYYILVFTLLSYGIPLLYMGIVTLPLGFLLHGTWHYGYGEPTLVACWLRYDTHFIWTFIVPVLLIILINIGFFIMAIVIMCKHDSRNKDHREKKAAVRQWLKATITLVIVMGLTWIMGIAVFDAALIPVAYIFTIFVAFQGVILFVVLIPLSPQVRKAFMICVRDRVNKSSFLSTYFGDKLESWMSKSRRDTNAHTSRKGNKNNGSIPQYQLGTFNDSGTSTLSKPEQNNFENPTYDEQNWNLDLVTKNPSAKQDKGVPTKVDVDISIEDAYDTIPYYGYEKAVAEHSVPTEYCIPVTKKSTIGAEPEYTLSEALEEERYTTVTVAKVTIK